MEISTNSSPTVSVIIPALNESRCIGRLLNALRDQDRRPDEIVVVDGRSDDDTAALVREFAHHHPDLSVQLLENREGTIPTALNGGISAARGEVVIRMDAHAIPRPTYVRHCLEILARSGADLVGGHWQIRPSSTQPMASAIAVAVGAPLGAGDAAYRLQKSTQPGVADTVPYGCFPKALWARLGGFNETLLANEDYEFNYRARLAGGVVYYDPEIESIYYAAETLQELGRKYFRYGWWKFQMLRKFPASIRWRQAVPLGALAFLLASLLIGPFVGWFVILGLCCVYGALLVTASARTAVQERDGVLLWALPLAFATIHFAWTIGGWVNFVTAGRWPDWRQPVQQRVSQFDEPLQEMT